MRRRKFYTSIFEYSFIVTILWIGFVLAISFVETPIRFHVDELETKQVLALGHRVFHALNGFEILFAILIGLGTLLASWNRACYQCSCVLLLILIVQSWMLFGILDERTLARIAGKEVAPASWHTIYIGLEIVKLILLSMLTWFQIQSFRAASLEIGKQD